MLGLSFFAGVEYKNNIFFSASFHNGLYKMDLNNKEIKLIGIFDNEAEEGILHREAFIYGQYAWFIPQEARNIARVNLETFQIDYFEFGGRKKTAGEEGYHAFVTAHKRDNMLYLVPRSARAVVTIDMVSLEIKEYSNVLCPEEEKTIDGIVSENFMYIFFKDLQYYKKFDLIDGKCYKAEFNYNVTSVCKGQQGIWLLIDDSKKIVNYDFAENKINKEIMIDSEESFYGMREYKNNFLLLPFCARGVLRIGVDQNIFMENECMDDELSVVKNSFVDSSDKMIFSINQRNEIAILDDEFNLEYYKIEVDFTEFLERAQSLRDNKRWTGMYENFMKLGMAGRFGLKPYLKYICMKENETKNVNGLGEMIYETL